MTQELVIVCVHGSSIQTFSVPHSAALHVSPVAMAMSKTTNTYNRQNWEDSEFPILCQTCLGDNPYGMVTLNSHVFQLPLILLSSVRMIKERFGKECKICNRPFTIFRWCPGARMRFKKTEVCQTCSKLKNVCQTCLLDLEYGLPTQVRDAALKVQNDLPTSDVNKEYYIQNVDRELAEAELGGSAMVAGAVGKAIAPSDVLSKLARTAPYYKRNRPHICSFWVKGECKRGEECPYRHDKPNEPDDPLSEQNIKDRYYGVNDPVAEKIMKRAASLPTLEPPEDRTITTLYVGNLGEHVTETDLKNHFYHFGEVRTITVVPRQQCGFVQFTKRSAAEEAAEKTFNKLVLGGRKLTIKWAHSQVGDHRAGLLLNQLLIISFSFNCRLNNTCHRCRDCRGSTILFRDCRICQCPRIPQTISTCKWPT